MNPSKGVIYGLNDHTMHAPDGMEDCADLAIAVGEVDGLGLVYVSKWEPTTAERQALIDGGAVYLYIVGGIHPPVCVSAIPPRVINAGEDNLGVPTLVIQ